MAGLGTTELLIILGVVVLLFGSTKLPGLARSLGQSARIFKSETKGLREGDEAEAAPAQAPAPDAAAAREEAARLREQAAKLEAQAAQAPQPLPQGQPDGTTINGVPLSQADQPRRTS
jgi:sec-independent protein translocase protein TatA